jgi:hypothetical protein
MLRREILSRARDGSTNMAKINERQTIIFFMRQPHLLSPFLDKNIVADQIIGVKFLQCLPDLSKSNKNA